MVREREREGGREREGERMERERERERERGGEKREGGREKRRSETNHRNNGAAQTTHAQFDFRIPHVRRGPPRTKTALGVSVTPCGFCSLSFYLSVRYLSVNDRTVFYFSAAS